MIIVKRLEELAFFKRPFFHDFVNGEIDSWANAETLFGNYLEKLQQQSSRFDEFTLSVFERNLLHDNAISRIEIDDDCNAIITFEEFEIVCHRCTSFNMDGDFVPFSQMVVIRAEAFMLPETNQLVLHLFLDDCDLYFVSSCIKAMPNSG